MRFPTALFFVILGVVCSGARAQVIFDSAKILPSNAGGWFGSAVAIDGDLAVVGAPRDSMLGDRAGAAYIIDISDPLHPVELFRLTAADAAPRDLFGSAVAIGDGYVAVGALGHFRDGDMNVGAAYIFDAATGTQLHRLEPAEGFNRQDRFGAAVAISEGDVFVGAPGYRPRGVIFRYDAASGTEIARIVPDHQRCCLDFGAVFAIEGDTLVAGIPDDHLTAFSYEGSVSVFDLNTNTQVHKFFAANPVERMYFGGFVAIEDGLIAVGAGRASHANGVYVHDAGTGEQVYALHPTGFGFDNALAMDSGRLLIVQGGDSAESFLYDAPTGDYLGQLAPSESVYRHRFGQSTALNGDVVLIGAPWDDETGQRSGATYLFRPEYLTTPCGPGDLVEPFGTLNFFDVSEYLRLFHAGDMAADLAEPFGLLNFFDVSEYLDLFMAGCP